MAIKTVSLFAGCGGTDVGLLGNFDFLDKHYAKNPIQIIYANDIEPSACDLYNKNFSHNIDCQDIKQVASIPAHDLLVAGFPCQSFSILAQNPPRLGYKDERGKLFFEVVRFLKKNQPKYFICENVKGLLSADKGKTFPLIVQELAGAGYVVKHQVINAADFGVPQKRFRVFIVGVRNDIDAEYVFPKPIVKSDEYTPVKCVLETDIDAKYWFSDKAVKGMQESNRKSKSIMNKGRAQDLSSPCNTVTAHLSKVSLNGTDPVLIINSRYRRFTPREVARIQGFPESYVLAGTDTNVYKALGNAISPVVAWHIVRGICDIDKRLANKTKGTHPPVTDGGQND